MPELDGYAWRLWDYWERHLDPDLFVDRSLRGKVEQQGGADHRRFLGHRPVHRRIKVAEAGAKVIIVARGEEELFKTRDEIIAGGRQVLGLHLRSGRHGRPATTWSRRCWQDHGHVDILVNNAGRSIRRSIEASYDRFHDFERTMQLNYFGCLRLIMGFLPAMTQRRKGHIINISSIGVLASSPRFSAYVASKAALDAFSRCAQGEFVGKNIAFTTINMPLVKTPMIAPTKMYDSVPTLSPEEAADLRGQGDHRDVRAASRRALGIFAGTAQCAGAEGLRSDHEHRVRDVPGFGRGQGRSQGPARTRQPTNEQIAFAALMRGVHW